MKIIYWDCKFESYSESSDGDDEFRYYGCSHPEGDGECEKDNKYCDASAECTIAELKAPVSAGEPHKEQSR